MFPLNQEQQTIKLNAAEFGRSNLAKNLIERESRSEFSRTDWKRLAEAGFTNIFQEPPLSIAAKLEGLGLGCPDNGLLMSLNAHLWGCTLPIQTFSSRDLTKTLLADLSSGKRIGAHAATEAQSGSDFFAMACSAESRGDRFIISGRKCYVTNAPVADVFVVYAKTGESSSAALRSISAFVVERGDPGVSIGEPYVKSALRTSPMAELRLEACALGPERLLGDIGDGFLVFNHSMQWERALILSSVVGAMERLLKNGLDYVKARKIGGKSISNFGGVKARLVAMKTRHEVSRLLVYRAAQALAGDENSMLLSSLAKKEVSEAYVKSCQDAMAIFGAQGLLVEREIERELRDAMASVVYSGTSDIQDEIISRLL